MKRRKFIQTTALAAAGVSILSSVPLRGSANTGGLFELPPLPYAPNALEPFIDEQTMTIHHGKHHKAYVDNLNKALSEAGIQPIPLKDLCRNISAYSPAIRNNAGGHFNHSLFWTIMGPGQELKMPCGSLSAAIEKDLGGLGNLQQGLSKAAMSVFGSGWAWLVINNSGKLEAGTTPNQDNPLMDVSAFKGFPILGIDVWEHAYYLKYQNRRQSYVDNWWSVINWKRAEQLYLEGSRG